MWVPKWQRDEKKGVDSPIPTQVVSNEEFVPRPQSKQQKQWESVIAEISEEKSKKLGLERRDFMRSSMGMATAFLASNMVFGENWEVSAEETVEPAATEENSPKGSTSLSTYKRTLPMAWRLDSATWNSSRTWASI